MAVQTEQTGGTFEEEEFVLKHRIKKSDGSGNLLKCYGKW